MQLVAVTPSEKCSFILFELKDRDVCIGVHFIQYLAVIKKKNNPEWWALFPGNSYFYHLLPQADKSFTTPFCPIRIIDATCMHTHVKRGCLYLTKQLPAVYYIYNIYRNIQLGHLLKMFSTLTLWRLSNSHFVFLHWFYCFPPSPSASLA